ncbi:hypothetical protein JFU37_05985 [Pseudomonas sp. TH41]|uniref:hypothetical protein n=1 Tax=Pseudomonas sp. TH41 TaxID=2796405 RepID=UPI001911AAF4|nr:hypothetical protein [Pseudomonas sp. TH41]MBK5352057.1 hypothetical protein [Pseudomonas sp. TH41]
MNNCEFCNSAAARQTRDIRSQGAEFYDKSFMFGCYTKSVGAAEGCDLLIFKITNQDQKIAACGSTYRGISQSKKKRPEPVGAFSCAA